MPDILTELDAAGLLSALLALDRITDRTNERIDRAMSNYEASNLGRLAAACNAASEAAFNVLNVASSFLGSESAAGAIAASHRR